MPHKRCKAVLVILYQTQAIMHRYPETAYVGSHDRSAHHRGLGKGKQGGGKKSAGTGVHRGDQLHARREIGLLRGPRNRYDAGFERFAQHFEHVAVEFGQFVEEQHAVVSQRYLARAGLGPAADEDFAALETPGFERLVCEFRTDDIEDELHPQILVLEAT